MGVRVIGFADLLRAWSRKYDEEEERLEQVTQLFQYLTRIARENAYSREQQLKRDRTRGIWH